jgi:hypothetical protein
MIVNRYRLPLLASLVAMALLFSPAGPQQGVAATHTLPPQLGYQWAPYLEWSLANASYSGNPYDVVATVTFRHTASGAVHTTEMFYDGGDTWKFRFSGALPGQWTFTTDSDDADLGGHSGSATILANPGAPGFVTGFGSQWGRTGTGEVFVPQFVMVGGPQVYYNNEAQIDHEIQLFLEEHGFNGFHTPVFCRWFDLEQPHCSHITAPDPNPDPRTFTALEEMIGRVYEAGGVVHIWLWGDDQRGQNPNFLPGGINGHVDRRLQRYIAARLGPMPGWTLSYGFDLWEWVSGDELAEWHQFMHQQLGWSHALGARASKNKLDQLSEVLDYSNYEQHRPTYETYVETIEARSCKPSFSEDRFRIRQPGQAKDYTMEMTRRGLWHSAMAGGVANIWGNLIGAAGANDGTTSSAPYPNPEWIKTYARFFEHRFLPGMVRCNELTDGVCLWQPAAGALLFYKENTTALNLDLSFLVGPQTAVAVDTRLPYAELTLDLLPPGSQVWRAPYASDWAVAVGNFDRSLPQKATLPTPAAGPAAPAGQPETALLADPHHHFLPLMAFGGFSSLICPPADPAGAESWWSELPSLTESYLYQNSVGRVHRAAYLILGDRAPYWLSAALAVALAGLAWRRLRR